MIASTMKHHKDKNTISDTKSISEGFGMKKINNNIRIMFLYGKHICKDIFTNTLQKKI
jgi:regulator of replication initiation timing